MGEQRPRDSHGPDGDSRTPIDTRPPQRESAAVIIRFIARLVILSVFAVLGTQGFARTFESLLVLAALYCVIVAPFRREVAFGPVLTHLDEAAAYALSARIVSWVY